MEEKRRELPQFDREAIAAQREVEQAWARENLKNHWLDEFFYRRIAAEYGLRLAPWWKPSSETRYIRRALVAAGKDSNWFKETFGYPLKDFHLFNPTTPTWVVQCIVLEFASYEKNQVFDYKEVA